MLKEYNYYRLATHGLRPLTQKGFTLLEVMVAMVVLGIGFATIFQLFSAVLNSVERSENFTKAAIFAKDKLNEAVALPEPQEGAKEGEAGEDNRFRWKVMVSRYDAGAFGSEPPFNIYQLSATVAWMEGLKEKKIHLDTLKTVNKK